MVVLPLLVFAACSPAMSRELTPPARVPSELEECLQDMVNRYFGADTKAALFFSSEFEGAVSGLLPRLAIPVQLNAFEQPVPEGLDRRPPCQLVLILDPSLPLSRILNGTLFTADTRFVFVARSAAHLRSAFHRFWLHKLVNVFAVVVSRPAEVTVYSFLPYGPQDCGSGEPMVVARWEGGRFTQGSIAAVADLSRIKDMHGCPVNVTVVDTKPNVMFQDECNCNGTKHIDGVEGRIMIEVSRKLNMSSTYYIARDGVGWGWIHPSPPRGVVGELFLRVSDFGIGQLAPTIERFENLDISVPFSDVECITFGVPAGAGKKQAKWINILVFEYSGLMWGLIVLTLTIFVLCYSFFSQYGQRTSKVRLVLFVFLSGLGSPVALPVSSVLRTLILAWVWFSFVITVSYQSSMGSRLTVPEPDPDINTFRELLDSELHITGYNNMIRLLDFKGNDGEIKQLKDHFEVTNYDMEFAVDLIATKRDSAFMRHTSTFIFYSLISPTARGNIHVIRDCPYQYYPAVMMQRRSPFLRRVNSVLSRLHEAGITQLWWADYIYSLPKSRGEAVPLRLKSTLGPFFILIFGHFVSLLCFGFECAISSAPKNRLIVWWVSRSSKTYMERKSKGVPLGHMALHFYGRVFQHPEYLLRHVLKEVYAQHQPLGSLKTRV